MKTYPLTPQQIAAAADWWARHMHKSIPETDRQGFRTAIIDLITNNADPDMLFVYGECWLGTDYDACWILREALKKAGIQQESLLCLPWKVQMLLEQDGRVTIESYPHERRQIYPPIGPIIRIATEFSRFPGGKTPVDGPDSGARLREEFLIPALQEYEVVTVLLDGTLGYGCSFLEEAFGGLTPRFPPEYLDSALVLETDSATLTYTIRTILRDAYQQYRRDLVRRVDSSTQAQLSTAHRAIETPTCNDNKN